MWVEKHRPQTVRGIRGQAATVERLAAYGEGGTFPHLLFAGPPGTGKRLLRLLFAPMSSVTNLKKIYLK